MTASIPKTCMAQTLLRVAIVLSTISFISCVFAAEEPRVIYVEIRNDKIVPIQLKELRAQAADALLKIKRAAGDDLARYIELVAGISVSNRHHTVELSYVLMGELRLFPTSPAGTDGQHVDEIADTGLTWFDEIINEANATELRVIVIVRGDDEWNPILQDVLLANVGGNAIIEVGHVGVSDPIIFAVKPEAIEPLGSELRRTDHEGGEVGNGR